MSTRSPNRRRSAPLRSGFVAIVGLPNVGKSTLMNSLVGERVSIVTHKPQTTRNRIVGILSIEARGQIAFVDTPGIHRSPKPLNRRMVRTAWREMGATHAALLVVDAPRALRDVTAPLSPEEEEIADALAAREIPALLVLNKVDRVEPKSMLLPLLERLGGDARFRALIPVSALRQDGLERVVELLLPLLPESAPLFPTDIVTDRAERFMASELIRQQLLLKTDKEVPYAAAVEVDRFEDNVEKDRLEIDAVIHVDRESQKGIVIGKGGQKLKQIGTSARGAMEEFFGRKVLLRTLVRVEEGWTERRDGLQRFGLDEGES